MRVPLTSNLLISDSLERKHSRTTTDTEFETGETFINSTWRYKSNKKYFSATTRDFPPDHISLFTSLTLLISVTEITTPTYSFPSCYIRNRCDKLNKRKRMCVSPNIFRPPSTVPEL